MKQAARVIVAAVVVRAFVLAPSAAVAQTATLHAEAGLGGIARPARWTPVHVALETGQADINGEIVVQWGEAAVHRTVAMTAPSRRTFDVFLRTPETQDAITVQLRATGVDRQTIDIPVRIISPEDEVAICAVADGAPSSPDCTAAVSVAALPQSVRGYDAADRVLWRAGPTDLLSPEQRTALSAWRAYSALDRADLLSQAPRLTQAAGPANHPRAWVPAVMSGLGAYALALAAAGWWARTSRGRPGVVFGATAILVALGSGLAITAGRVGPSSAIVVRHRSTMIQLAGGMSLISMRGIAEYPAFDDFQLHAEADGVSLEAAAPPHLTWQVDDAGHPEMTGVAGLGARREFALDGVVAVSPLRVERHGKASRVVNSSAADLSDCAFTDGYAMARVGGLGAGRSVEERTVDGAAPIFFACKLTTAPVAFAEARHPVSVLGDSLIAVSLAPDPTDGAEPPSP